MMPGLSLTVSIDRFPIAGNFTISRGSKTEAVVVTATVSDGQYWGRGECVPYARYGENVDDVAALISAQAGLLASGGRRAEIAEAMAPGAARNALDCALWDYEAKSSGKRAWELAGIAEPPSVTTCYTISLGEASTMESAARKAADFPLLKVKLGGDGDAEGIAAVRRGAPEARLVVDANEAWTEENFSSNADACAYAGVELIEQPLPAHDDEILETLHPPVPLCADESAHTSEGLEKLARRYQAVNIKLDKTGGLTEALVMAQAAKNRGLDVMVGCMLASSLAMAPAMLITPYARWVDLDGPLLLAMDRKPALKYENGQVYPPQSELWG